MRFKVIKAGPDGISGGAACHRTVAEVLREIFYHKGWPSLEALHAAVTEWAAVARPGDVFCTQVTAVVAVAVDTLARTADECHHCGHVGLDYGTIDPVEDGGIEQKVSCPACGERWKDVFTLTDQRALGRPPST